MAYYDYDEDRQLIKGAFCATFGMLPQDFEDLTYSDYIDLFPSISGETTFAHILHIRMETDMDLVKDFSQSEYAEWAKYQLKKKEFDKHHQKRNEEINKKRNDERNAKLQIAEEKLQKLLNKNPNP